jgi:hypothetical protein
VLPPLACYRPEAGAVSLRYAGGLDLWEKIREFAAVRGSEGPPGAPGLWRRLFIEAMAAFFRAWQYSSRRIVPGHVSPTNIVVPELDYRDEPMISSLQGWKPYEDTLSLVRPMVGNFYFRTVAHYPWSLDQLDCEWIFDACTEALGRREALIFWPAQDRPRARTVAVPGGGALVRPRCLPRLFRQEPRDPARPSTLWALQDLGARTTGSTRTKGRASTSSAVQVGRSRSLLSLQASYFAEGRTGAVGLRPAAREDVGEPRKPAVQFLELDCSPPSQDEDRLIQPDGLPRLRPPRR